MADRKPFIPASARHHLASGLGRASVDKAVRDLIASGVADDEEVKRDGKQGALDGTPYFALGRDIGRVDIPGRLDDDDKNKDSVDKSTDKLGKEEKDGKEMKEAKEGKDGKESKDTDEGNKHSSDTVEFGFLRYGIVASVDSERLGAAVVAHAARGLARGPMV